MFKNFHNSLNSLEYQYSVQNSLLHLHSNFQDAINQLDVPSFRLPTVGSRVFPIAGAKVWNSLPDDVTSTPSLSTFRRHLKIHLFRCCYNTLWFCSSAVLTLTIWWSLLWRCCLGHSKNLCDDDDDDDYTTENW